jgi:hypothetical protein
MTNIFRKCVNPQIEIMTVRKRKQFLIWQNIIDSVLSQLLAIEVIKYHPEAGCAERAIEALKTSLELHLKILEKGCCCCLAHIETISSLYCKRSH